MVILVGDLHGEWAGLHALGEMLGESANTVTVVQVGDFGWSQRALDAWTDPGYPVYALDGNHEDHEWLARQAAHQDDAAILMRPNLYFVQRAAVLTFGDLRLGCLGGATSVDKAWRKCSPLEDVTDAEVDALLARRAEWDVLVTHAPPEQVIRAGWPPLDRAYWGLPSSWEDVSAKRVQRLWEESGRPPIYSGHMHRSFQYENARILNIVEMLHLKGVA